MAEEGEWLTVPQVARYLGLGVAVVRRKVNSGEIPSVVDGQRPVRLVRRSHVDAWVREQRVKPGSLASSIPTAGRSSGHRISEILDLRDDHDFASLARSSIWMFKLAGEQPEGGPPG